jgi:hypothetical protein
MSRVTLTANGRSESLNPMTPAWRRRSRQGEPTESTPLAPLAEYLFVDDARLDTYFQQISAPVAYDKIPSYQGTIGLTGPAITAGSQQHQRDFTRHEKVQAVLDYLQRGGFVASSRVGEDHWTTQSVFRFETCHGARAVLPVPNAERGLAIWICDPPDDQAREESHSAMGRLYLVEDFRGADFDGPYHQAVSGYSALLMMLEDRDFQPAMEQAGLRFDHAEAFAVSPLELVGDLGGKVGGARTIRTLYRIRDTLNEQHAEFSVVTIGYPIVITEYSQ